MHKTPSESPIVDWARVRFGIEDEDELRTVLADPSEMLALLDVVRAAGQDEMSCAIARTPHLV